MSLPHITTHESGWEYHPRNSFFHRGERYLFMDMNSGKRASPDLGSQRTPIPVRLTPLEANILCAGLPCSDMAFGLKERSLTASQGERKLRHWCRAIRTSAKLPGDPNMILRTDICADKRFLAGPCIPSRRHYPRVETPCGVWVYWHCEGLEDTSQVRDLCIRGLFVQTERARHVDAPIRLDFLVQEGQIRTEAVVRHTKPGRGLGLKFIALNQQDGPRLTALMTRLLSFSRSRTNSK